MANRRFIDFPIASTVGDNDIVLIWQDGANKQTTKATILSGLPENLEDLNDVVISGLTNGQILRYDSVTGKWENTDQGNLDLNDLNDVSIVSPSNGQVLVYNSSTSKWENSSGGFVPYVGAVTTVDLGAQGLRAGYVRFDTSVASVPQEQGLMFWDADDETVDIILNGYTMKIGEDLFYPVKNQTGSTIAKGTAVRFNGTVGNSGRLLIAPFIANGSVASNRFMGVTAEEILNGEDGKVLYFGRIRDINTNAFNEGDILYASTTVAGGFQTAIPVAPNNIVLVAAVVTKSINQGTIFVRPTLASNLNTDEAVKITSVANLDLLQYQSGTGLWENKTLAQILGGTASQFVKGNGSLDSTSYQPLLTNPVTGTGAAGRVAYWNGSGTITSDAFFQWNDFSKRLGIGRTPTVSLDVEGAGFFSGSVTALSIIKSGGTSSQYLMADGSVSTLTNPVTGTGTTNYLPKFTGTSTIGNSNLINDASGNLGLGVTPSAWAGINGKIFELGYSGGSAAFFQNGTDDFWTASNAYFNAGWKYTKNGTATAKLMSTGGHYWFTAPSGTAGNAISFTQAMTLTSGGNLLVGTTSDNGSRLQVSGTAQATKLVSASNAFAGTLDFGTGAFRGIMDYTASTGLWSLNNQTAGASSTAYFQFQADSSPILTMLKSGNVGIGTSSPAYKLVLESASTTYASSPSVAFYDTVVTADARNWMIGNIATDYGSFNIASSTTQGGVPQTPRLTINKSGNVGIGTTLPNDKFHVVGGIYSTGLTTPTNTNIGSIQIGYDGTNGIVRTWNSSPLIFSNYNYQAFETTGTERMRITSSGNVLIGTTTDNGARLQVIGFSRFDRGTLQFTLNPSYAGGNVYSQLQSTGALALATGGDNNRLYIDTSGNVGIGTSSPSAPLHLVTPTGVNFQNAIRFEKAGGYGEVNLENYYTTGSNYGFGIDVAGTTMMVVNNLGNVGIGTSSPATRLMVQDSGNTFVGHFSGLNQTNGVAIGTNSLNVAVIQGYTRTFSATNNIALQTDGGNLLVGTTTDNGARLQVSGDQTINATQTYTLSLNNTAQDTRMQFQVNGTQTFQLSSSSSQVNIFGTANIPMIFYTNSTERMRITSGGDVGIGTSTPDVFGRFYTRTFGISSSSSTAIQINGGSGGYGQIDFGAAGVRTAGISASANETQWGSVTAIPAIIYTNGSERMRITSSGNVGIGTSSPTTYSLSGTHVENFGGSTYAFIHNNTTTVKSFYATNESAGLSVLYTFSNHPLLFGTNNTERMRITSGGNVLIGTTTDVGAKLHVNGDIRTSAPSGGSAVNWKLGTVRGGTVTPNATVRVEIGGVLVDLDARYV